MPQESPAPRKTMEDLRREFWPRIGKLIVAGAVIGMGLVAITGGAFWGWRQHRSAERFRQELDAALQLSLYVTAPNLSVGPKGGRDALQQLADYTEGVLPYFDFSATNADQHGRAAYYYEGLSGIYLSLGNPEKARIASDSAVKIRLNTYGDESPMMVRGLQSRAGVIRWEGRFLDALPLIERCVELERGAEKDLPYDLIGSMNQLALVMQDMGNYDRAEALRKEALVLAHNAQVKLTTDIEQRTELKKVEISEKRMEVIETFLNDGVTLAERQKAAAIIELYPRNIRDALFAHNRTIDRLDTANVILGNLNANLGGLMLDRDEVGEAERCFDEAESYLLPRRGAASQPMAAVMNYRGSLAYKLGDYAQADACWRESLSRGEATFGTLHPDLAGSYINLARLDIATGQFGSGRDWIEQAYTRRAAHFGPEHPQTANVVYLRAALADLMGDSDAATSDSESVVRVRRVVMPNRHDQLLMAMAMQARVMTASPDRREEAAEMAGEVARRGVEAWKDAPQDGGEAAIRCDVRQQVGRAYLANGKHDEALAMFQASIGELTPWLEKDPRLAQTRRRLMGVHLFAAIGSKAKGQPAAEYERDLRRVVELYPAAELMSPEHRDVDIVAYRVMAMTLLGEQTEEIQNDRYALDACGYKQADYVAVVGE